MTGLLDTALVRRVRQTPALRPPAIAAYRMLDRMMPARPGPRVVANSMPKSGTHLLASMLDQLDGMRFSGRLVTFDAGDRFDPDRPLAKLDTCLKRLRDSHYIGGHLIRDPRVEQRIVASGAKLLTILRDPRAVVVSGAHYVMDARHIQGRDEALEGFPDHASVLRAMVFGRGEPGERFYFPEIGERFRRYADWADSSAGMTVLFEDLIGHRGGGSRDDQVAQVAAILDFLGYDADSSSAIAEQMFSEKAITFRAGRIDSWRDDLTPELVGEIEHRCGDTMARLGYSA